MVNRVYFVTSTPTRALNAKLTCHPARSLLRSEIIERCGLATVPATVELLPCVLPY